MRTATSVSSRSSSSHQKLSWQGWPARGASRATTSCTRLLQSQAALHCRTALGADLELPGCSFQGLSFSRGRGLLPTLGAGGRPGHSWPSCEEDPGNKDRRESSGELSWLSHCGGRLALCLFFPLTKKKANKGENEKIILRNLLASAEFPLSAQCDACACVCGGGAAMSAAGQHSSPALPEQKWPVAGSQAPRPRVSLLSLRSCLVLQGTVCARKENLHHLLLNFLPERWVGEPSLSLLSLSKVPLRAQPSGCNPKLSWAVIN